MNFLEQISFAVRNNHASVMDWVVLAGVVVLLTGLYFWKGAK